MSILFRHLFLRHCCENGLAGLKKQVTPCLGWKKNNKYGPLQELHYKRKKQKKKKKKKRTKKCYHQEALWKIPKGSNLNWAVKQKKFHYS